MASELARVLSRRRSVVDQECAKTPEHRRWSCPGHDRQLPVREESARVQTSKVQNHGNEKKSTEGKFDEDKLKRLCAKYLPGDVKTPLELPETANATEYLFEGKIGAETMNHVHPLETAADATCKAPIQQMVVGDLCDGNQTQAEHNLHQLKSTDDVLVVSRGKLHCTERLDGKTYKSPTGDHSPHAGLEGEALHEIMTRHDDEAASSHCVDAENPSKRLSALDTAREEPLREKVCSEQVFVQKNTAGSCDQSNLLCGAKHNSDIVFNTEASNSNDAAAHKSVGRLDKTRFMVWEKSVSADSAGVVSKKHASIESQEGPEGVPTFSTSRTIPTDEATPVEKRLTTSPSDIITSDGETRLLAGGLSPSSHQVAEYCRENMIDLGLLADASAISPIPSLFNKPGADEVKLSVSCIEATVETRCARQAFFAWLLVAGPKRSAAPDQDVVFVEETRAETGSRCERSSPLVCDGGSNTSRLHVVTASDARSPEDPGEDCFKCEMDLVAEIQGLQELLRKKTFLVESIRKSTGGESAAASLNERAASELQSIDGFAQSQQVIVELAKAREDCSRLTHEAENSKKELLELRSKLNVRPFTSSVQTFDISSPLVCGGTRAVPGSESVQDSCAKSTTVFPLTIDVASKPQFDMLRNSCPYSCPSARPEHGRSCDKAGSQICMSAAQYLTGLTSTEISGAASCGSSLETTRSATSTPRRFSAPWLQDRRVAVPVEIVSRKSPAPVQSCSRHSSVQGGLRLGDNRGITPRNVLPAATSSRQFRSGGSSMSVASRRSPGGVSVISRVPAVRAS